MRLSMRVSSIFLFLALVLSAVPSSAQQSLNTGNSQVGILKSYDSEQITVAAVAIGFTASKINPTVTSGSGKAVLATCYNATAEIKILSTGTAPTSTVGLVIPIGGSFQVWGYDDISNFKAIRTGGSSATLDCQYSRLR
jgi:hypothetical protein